MAIVCDAYNLTPEWVRAALGYAANLIGHEQIYDITST
jgi:uncharacterized protein (DUF433 family)